MKLISMTDFVLNGMQTADYVKLYDGCRKYANFLKQPLTLGMFVPCDKEGNFLDPVIQMDYQGFEDYPAKHTVELYEYDLKKYQEAKERVFFKGFRIRYSGSKTLILTDGFEINKDCFNSSFYIEYICGNSIILTESAIKQLGL